MGKSEVKIRFSRKIGNLHVTIIILHVDINKSQVNKIIFHVDRISSCMQREIYHHEIHLQRLRLRQQHVIWIGNALSLPQQKSIHTYTHTRTQARTRTGKGD